LLKKIKDEIVNMQLIKNDYVIEFYQAKKYPVSNLDLPITFILYVNIAMEQVLPSTLKISNI
jgi:hypothetical protein